MENELEQEVHEAAPEHKHGHKPKSLFAKGIVSGIVGIVVIIIVVGVIAAYRAPDSTPVFPAILSAIHAPAATVDGTVISWHDVKTDSDALALYLSKAGSKADAPDVFRARVLHRQMLTVAAEKYAAEQGVVVTTDQLDKELESIAQASGGKDKVESDIKANFGWTYEQYRDRVVKSMMILQELQKKLADDQEFNAPARAKIEAALAEVKAGKKDFGTIAKEVSEDSSAAQGGDLGYLKKGDTVAPFDKALFSMKKGEVSDIVQTEFGFHIIKIEDIKKDAKGQVVQVRAQHILIKYPSVVAKIQDWLDHASVHQFMHTSVSARADMSSGVPQE